jgi:hypothetical protein
MAGSNALARPISSAFVGRAIALTAFKDPGIICPLLRKYRHNER